LRGLRAAATFLTRVPAGGDVHWPDDLARSLPWFAVVGGLVGAAVGGVRWGLGLFLPAGAAAALAVGVGLAVTGALHEDGLADTFDGMGAGRDRDRALQIMADSRLGTFGAAALVIGLVTKVALLASLEGREALAACVSAGGLGRMAAVAWMTRPARAYGLGAELQSHVTRGSVTGAMVVGVAVGLAAGRAGAVATPIAVATSGLIAWWAMRRLGGITGDVLGAIVVVSEVTVLAVVVALVGWISW